MNIVIYNNNEHIENTIAEIHPQIMEKQLNIELGPEEAEGIYSNLVLISHSPAEFVLDFTRILPGKPKAKVYSRIIMAPQHAKSLLNALQDNIKKYEEQFGEIKIHGHEQGKNFGFQEKP